MDFYKWQLYWRISTTSTLARQNLFLLGIPPPTTPVYKEYAALVQQSQGGQSRQGYINVTLLWDTLTRQQGFKLKALVEVALAAGSLLYATVDYNDGTYGPGHFVDISGVPHPVVLEPAGNSQGLIYSNVTLFVNNCTIVNNPATGL